MKIGDKVAFELTVKGFDVPVVGEIIAKSPYFDVDEPCWMVRVENIPVEYKYIQDAQGGLRRNQRGLKIKGD